MIGSHQGLLDQWLEFGVIGVVLVLAAYAACIVRVVARILAGDSSPVVPAALGLWTATITASLTEGVLIRPGLVTIGLVSALLLNTPMSLPSRGVGGPYFAPERVALPWASPDAGRRLGHPPHPSTGSVGTAGTVGSPRATPLSPGDRGATTEG